MAMNEENAEIPESTIVIRFAAPGAVLMTAEWRNCYPAAQLLVAGEYLTRRSKELMEQAEKQQRAEMEANKITVPAPKIITP